MSFRGRNTVSFRTLSGRVRVRSWVREYQAPRREAIQGQAALLYRHGTFFLAVTLEMPEPKLDTPDGGTLGVDLGIVNLATDSDGDHFSGQAVERTRVRMITLRAALQS